MLQFLNKWLLRLTQEQLFPNQQDWVSLGTLSKPQREALYKYLTFLSYSLNKDEDRMASLRIRNKVDAITYSPRSKSEGERPPAKPTKPSDFLPDALKHELPNS